MEVSTMAKTEFQKKLKLKNLTPFSYDFFDIIINIESSYNQFAYNVFSGAKGLMQLTEIACRDVNRNYESLYESDYNVDTGLLYFQKLYYDYNSITKNDIKKVVCAYNMGIGNLNNLINIYGEEYILHLPGETKNYIEKFEKLMLEKGKNWNNII